jgi:hypothetical protein
VQVMLGNCARTTKNWMLVNREGDATKLDAWASELERRSGRPSCQMWVPMMNLSSGRRMSISHDLAAELGINFVTGIDDVGCVELRPLDSA